MNRYKLRLWAAYAAVTVFALVSFIVMVSGITGLMRAYESEKTAKCTAMAALLADPRVTWTVDDRVWYQVNCSPEKL